MRLIAFVCLLIAAGAAGLVAPARAQDEDSDEPCIAEGTPYNVSGKLTEAGLNEAHVPMYMIEAKICSDAGSHLYYTPWVVMYPSKLIAGCRKGRIAHASGKLSFYCQEDEMGGLGCMPGLNDVTLTCEKK